MFYTVASLQLLYLAPISCWSATHCIRAESDTQPRLLMMSFRDVRVELFGLIYTIRYNEDVRSN